MINEAREENLCTGHDDKEETEETNEKKKMPRQEEQDTNDLNRTGAPETEEAGMGRHLQSIIKDNEKESTTIISGDRVHDSSIHIASFHNTEGPDSKNELSALCIESQTHMTSQTKAQYQLKATRNKSKLVKKTSRTHKGRTQPTRKKMGNPNSKVENEI